VPPPKVWAATRPRPSSNAVRTPSTAEADARRYYDEHRDEFVKDERVRVSHIFLSADRAAPDRQARAAEARKLQARFKAEATKNPLAFANAAREVSDDVATKPSGGDLGFRTKDEIEKTWSRVVADAALALRNVGDESQVIESDRGFHLLRLTGRQPATNRSFDEVKGQLGARVGRDRRTKEFEEFVKGLRQKYKIEVVDSELEKIQVSAATPAASTQADPLVPAPPAAKQP
jgi:peptidyl-prolyl cis-trans isomerase C